MKLFIVLLSLILAFWFSAQAEAGQMIRGPTFEGVIFTPEEIHGSYYVALSQPCVLWTPSRNLVLKAEAALPAALAIAVARPIRPNLPKFYTAKNGTNLNLSFAPSALYDTGYDFETDFIYGLHPLHQYKRQYVGETVGKAKILVMRLIYEPDILTDSFFLHWKQQPVEGRFWRVLYNDSKGSFSDWEYIDLP